MIGTLDVECQAKNPNLPLAPMTAFINSPSSLRIRNVPKRIGDWCIRNVYVTCVYPDSSIQSVQCVLVGGIWVGTIQGTSTSGTSKNGYTIFADGTDENGNNVTGYVLGKGDIEILEADGTLSPDPARYYVKLLSAEATQPREGDLYPTDDGYVIWQNGQANLLGTPFEQITAYVDSAISSKADLSTLDDYAKIDELSSKADLSAIPTKTSELSNDSGFLTSAEIAPYHSVLTPTENTGLANTAYKLALADYTSFEPVDGGNLHATLRTNRDLTNEFRAKMSLATYYPYVMSKYNGQTLSPELSLYFCKDSLRYGTRPLITYYEGYMFRTGGAGFAIPCSEDGTPDGRLIETTGVQQSYVRIANNTSSVHSIGFSGSSNDPYNNIITIDGQSDMIFAHRTNAYKMYTMLEELANKSELPTKTSELSNDSGFITSSDVPTKTSDLTNDSGFITSADIITKRDLNDFNVYVDPMADMTTTKFNVVVSYAFDPSSPLFTVELTHSGGVGTSWVWSPSGSNQRINIDYYSNNGSYNLFYLNIQDGGGTEHSGQMVLPIAAPYWTGEAHDDQFHFSVTSQTTTITTKAYVDSLIAALEARISALENS